MNRHHDIPPPTWRDILLGLAVGIFGGWLFSAYPIIPALVIFTLVLAPVLWFFCWFVRGFIYLFFTDGE